MMQIPEYFTIRVHAVINSRFPWQVTDDIVGIKFKLIKIQDELYDGEEIARCPSCSLLLRVIYDPVSSIEILSSFNSFIRPGRLSE